LSKAGEALAVDADAAAVPVRLKDSMRTGARTAVTLPNNAREADAAYFPNMVCTIEGRCLLKRRKLAT